MLVNCAGITELHPAPRAPRVYRQDEKTIPAAIQGISEGRFFYERPGPMRDDLIDVAGMFWLDDGSVVGRRAYPSAAGPDLYDLVSLGSPTLVGVRILQAALIVEIKTKAGAGLYAWRQMLNRVPPIAAERRAVSR